MLTFLRFRKRSVPSFPTPITAEAIYSYLLGLKETNKKRLEDEIQNRGLSFGDLRVSDMFVGPRFEIIGEKIKTLSFTALKAMIQEILDTSYRLMFKIDFCNEESKYLSVIWNNSDRKRISLQVFMLSNSLEVEVHGVTEMNILLILARRLGLRIEPAHFAYESNVPISRVVDYAHEWYDGERDLYFLEVKCYESLVKSRVYHGGGSFTDFKRGNITVNVFCSRGYRPRMRINNVFLKPRKIRGPTPQMKAANIPHP